MALHCLIENIYIQLSQNNLQFRNFKKTTLISFLQELSVKISHDCPTLADLLLAD